MRGKARKKQIVTKQPFEKIKFKPPEPPGMRCFDNGPKERPHSLFLTGKKINSLLSIAW